MNEWMKRAAEEIVNDLPLPYRRPAPEVEKFVAAKIERHYRAATPTERTDADYAIEHARYLADAAEAYLEERNKFDMLNAVDVGDQDSLNDHIRALRDRVFEFRKRAARAATKAETCPKCGTDTECDVCDDPWHSPAPAVTSEEKK